MAYALTNCCCVVQTSTKTVAIAQRMTCCGFAVAPANAHPLVKERAHAVTEAGGGRGVWMALQGPDEPARTRWVKLPESGEINRPQLVTALLDELRRFLPAR